MLDSYEAERSPIAASALGLSQRLHLRGSMRRGRETKQLGLNYRHGPLAHAARRVPRGLQAGDRAPDAPCCGRAGEPRRLFDVFRGPHWTLLLFGFDRSAEQAFRASSARWALDVRCVNIQAELAAGSGEDALVDHAGEALRAYGVARSAAVLVRPDGYIGFFGVPATAAELEAFVSRVASARETRSAARSQAAELAC